MTLKEIKLKYPPGTIITDAFGTENMQVRSDTLRNCEFKSMGTIILGSQYIYNPDEDRWAVITGFRELT